MIVKDETAMRAFGAELARSFAGGELITLHGPLGAGKTALAKAVIAELGFGGDVSSPTFAIIHHYDAPEMRLPVVHADLYRLNDPDELAELGLFDNEHSLILVEWPDKGGAALSNPDVAISIEPREDGSRLVKIEDKRMQA
ncbi:MAG: tRNA (adenosine(37)-N6)-threonylcarbamoyltransferase complex ATPase subunit type 1 TsaE [Sphingorhabdus sp.]